jgi:hypothetical protein
MQNITALIVALTLFGSPVATIACLTECETTSMMPGACHHSMTARTDLTMTGGGDCAMTAGDVTPYVKEDRLFTGPAVVASAPVEAAPVLEHLHVPALVEHIPAACLKPPLVLRI